MYHFSRAFIGSVKIIITYNIFSSTMSVTSHAAGTLSRFTNLHRWVQGLPSRILIFRTDGKAWLYGCIINCGKRVDISAISPHALRILGVQTRSSPMRTQPQPVETVLIA
jgi:hypothetical protein